MSPQGRSKRRQVTHHHATHQPPPSQRTQRSGSAPARKEGIIYGPRTARTRAAVSQSSFSSIGTMWTCSIGVMHDDAVLALRSSVPEMIVVSSEVSSPPCEHVGERSGG